MHYKYMCMCVCTHEYRLLDTSYMPTNLKSINLFGCIVNIL